MKFGYVAIVGKPNVGKSTLLNQIIGTKVSIVSPKPGTTRIRILGVKNIPDEAQIVFLDTPGIYRPKDALGEAMVQVASASLQDADIILFMIDAEDGWLEDDELVFSNYIKPLAQEKHIFLVINKVDRVGHVSQVLPLAEEIIKKHGEFKEVLPISALKGYNIDELLKTILKYLPDGKPLFPPEMLTDLPLRLLAAEIVREKVLMKIHQEIPQGVAVVITEISEGTRDPSVLVIKGEIVVDRENYKPIIIGKGGQRLKSIGKLAREELELITGRKVYLELWVKVKPDWRKRPELVKSFGYRLE
ncbi:GTP-binding protein Era [Hydrogenobacter thermophilus TK-6]|uniref:GTPase Era n=1 Tax=Hydrogenobacter thermophilus (strain DSM 6534 / IAM 12695 / TK-6) TaxID=608538 RepID=D3DHX6_HYDTT|nr:GTPase Era [Hydrogenobacter thermophilus]ADO45361.1 GTP-binding protein Era [Hydrogenobacter thermophilus TK-6]BAI69428.1 GTP-binding protein [Hydrogenobacter thermophilus TK-6]